MPLLKAKEAGMLIENHVNNVMSKLSIQILKDPDVEDLKKFARMVSLLAFSSKMFLSDAYRQGLAKQIIEQVADMFVKKQVTKNTTHFLLNKSEPVKE